MKEISEEPEAREAIKRILNEANSLLKQQQQEQEEMIRNRRQEEKRQQQVQMQLLRQQRNAEKQAKVAEAKVASDSGSYSAPVIPGNQKSVSSFSMNQPPLNRTMSTPTSQAQRDGSNGQSSQMKPQYIAISSSAASDGKQIFKNSLPLPQAPGVYIIAPGQQLIKQPQHVQAEMMSHDIQKDKSKVASPSLATTTASQKPSAQPYVVTHHDLPYTKSNSDQQMVCFLNFF